MRLDELGALLLSAAVFWMVISAALVEMRHGLILHAYPLIRLFFPLMT